MILHYDKKITDVIVIEASVAKYLVLSGARFRIQFLWKYR